MKAFLIVRRNQTRDYLDVAALSDRYGVDESAEILRKIDQYYADQQVNDEGVRSQLERQLAEPRPADFQVTRQLDQYRNLADRWTRWDDVVEACRQLADTMARRE
ncbi:hypothetical protein [Salininema proteolyticum]|uniref:Uncharacterized protein n=1 Tax=Salininema proteolyticum TaxID=1607685 RepID=A0ABV8TVM1_9ACTN